MKKVYFLSLLLCMSLAALSQPVTIYSTGAAGSFTTGNGTATTRNDNTIISTAATTRGYAVIDLSAVPAGAIITSVTINFNIAALTGFGFTFNVRGFAGDLSTVTDPAALFTDMGSGVSLSAAFWGFMPGNVTLASTAASIGFVQANIGSKVSVAWTGGNMGVFTITGETGTATTTGAHAPYLVINYTIPPPCPAPTSATATAVPNPICVGDNLNLTGTATGATTYTWAGPGGYTATGLTQSPVATLSSAGVYTFTATNACAGGTPTSITATTVGIFVLAAPSPISGIDSVCRGSTTLLTDPDGGGFWSSGASGVASVDGSGLVTGVAAGTATISYTTPATGCSATLVVTVSAPTGAISGRSTICLGNNTTLTDPSPGGSWTSSDAGIAGVTSGGVVTGNAIGSATITYTIPGSACPPATFNVTVTGLPVAITGPRAVCTGTTVTLSDFTGGGTWSSGSPAVATIDSVLGIVTGLTVGTTNITYTITASGCFATTVMSVNLSPDTIVGPHVVCFGSTITLTDATGGGAWSSNDAGVAPVGPGTGVVTGLSLGVATISYSIGGVCPATQSVTVNPIPVAVFGPHVVCTGSSVTLNDGTAGGTWSSSDNTIATIDSMAGVVTGVTAGAVTISYTVAGCFATFSFSVNQAPADIAGPAEVCQFATITLTNGTPGDTWSSTNNSIATVDAGGIVTGVLPGVDTILYTDPASTCFASYPITVNLAPGAIVGTSLLCTGSSVTYTDAVGGGTWSSTNTAVATIDSLSGVALATLAGTDSIKYTITVGGCFASLLATVNDPPAAIVGTVNVVCVGLTITFTDPTPALTWTTTSGGAIGSIDAGGIVTGIAAGLDTVVYTDPGTTCFVIFPFTVNPVPAPITGSPLICTNSTGQLADADPDGTWASTQTTIATVDGTGLVFPVLPGLDTITYTFATGCMATLAVTVNDPPAAIVGTVNVVCVGGQIGFTDPTPALTWTTFSAGAISSIDGTGLLTGIVAGEDTVIYTDPGTTCSVNFPITVNPVPSAITGSALVCTGNSTLLSDVDAGGTWSSVTTAVATIDVDGNVFGVTVGTSVISYTFITGCAATIEVTVNNPPGVITGTPDSLICTGSSYTLIPDPTSPGGFWTSSLPGVVSVDPLTGTITGVSGGTANITYTMPATTCFSIIPITDVDPPAPISGASDQVCEGGTIVLSESSPGGLWTSTNTANATVGSAGAVVIVSGVLAGLDTINYTITGCPAAQFPITVNPTPQPIVGTDNVCFGLTTTLTDPTTGGSWTSSDATIASIDASGVVYGLTVGIVEITYTLPAGCFVTLPFTVNPLPAVIATTTIFVVCEGSTIMLTDASPGGLWSSGNLPVATVGTSDGIVTGVSGGVADITYTLPTGCLISTPVTVNPLPAPILGPSPAVVCVDAHVTLTNATTSGTWSSGDPAIATIDFLTGDLLGVSAGSVNITYAITTGCISVFTITVNPIPAAIFGPSPSQVCAGSNITLSEVTGGGTWSSSNLATATVDATGIVYGVASGVIDISYTITVTGCFVTTPVTVNPLPAPIGGTANVCEGRTTILTDADAGGVWTSGNTSIATVDPLTGEVTGVLSGGVLITYTLPTTCSITLPITVLASPPTTVTAGGPLTFCAGGSVLLSAPVAAGYTYQWLDETGAIPGAVASTYSAISDGTYSVVVTNAFGCFDTSTETVVVAEIKPHVTYSGPTNFCYNNYLVLTVGTGGAVGIFTYQWYRSGTAIPGAVNATYAANTSGIFWCVVNTTGASGTCTDASDSVTIVVYPLPTPTITFDGTTLKTDNTYTAYQWFINTVGITGAVSYSYVPTVAGSYRVLVVDANGCDGYSNAIAINTVGVGIVNQAGIKIYPNPATNILHIESSVNVRAIITGIEGKELINEENAKDIDITSLPAGLFIITLYNDNGDRLMIEKMVKE